MKHATTKNRRRALAALLAVVLLAGLLPAAAMAEPAEKDDLQTNMAATRTVNVRSGPGTSFSRVGKLSKGDAVKALAVHGKWLIIEWEGGTAYAYRSYFAPATGGTANAEALASALEASGYFTTNKDIFCGTFIDDAGVLNIRITRNASVSDVTSDISQLLGVKAGRFNVVRSALPAFASETYFRNLSTIISARNNALSTADRARIGFSQAGYDPATDEFTVELVQLTDEKQQLFRRLLHSWSCITFASTDAPAAPQAGDAPTAGAPTLDVPSTDPGTLGAHIALRTVNVRSGPGKTYEKLGTLKKGDRVAVWSIDAGWARITWQSGSRSAYVYADYLAVEG